MFPHCTLLLSTKVHLLEKKNNCIIWENQIAKLHRNSTPREKLKRPMSPFIHWVLPLSACVHRNTDQNNQDGVNHNEIIHLHNWNFDAIKHAHLCSLDNLHIRLSLKSPTLTNRQNINQFNCISCNIPGDNEEVSVHTIWMRRKAKSRVKRWNSGWLELSMVLGSLHPHFIHWQHLQRSGQTTFTFPSWASILSQLCFFIFFSCPFLCNCAIWSLLLIPLVKSKCSNFSSPLWIT